MLTNDPRSLLGSYWASSIPWYPDACFGPYRKPAVGYSRRELLADGIVHSIGLIGGAAAMLHLFGSMSAQLPVGVEFSIYLYAASFLLMLCCSSLWNGLAWHTKYLRLLQLADHAGILILICGSYSPMMISACHPRLLCLNWALACMSAVVKASKSRLDAVWFHIPLFVSMGWSVVGVWEAFWSHFSPWAKERCVLAGVLYTVGLLPWAANRIEGHNALWHMFVLAGSAAFYSVILHEVGQATLSQCSAA